MNEITPLGLFMKTIKAMYLVLMLIFFAFPVSNSYAQAQPWQKSKITDDSYLYWRYDANGDVQCATSDVAGYNCQWNLAQQQTVGAGTLTCGADHQAKYQINGYSQPLHWCAILLQAHPSVQWKKSYVAGSDYLFWRFNSDGDVQCLTYDVEGRNCQWGAVTAQTNTYGILTCGDDHQLKFGTNGYNQASSWCAILRQSSLSAAARQITNDTGVTDCYTTLGSNAKGPCSGPIDSNLAKQDGKTGIDVDPASNDPSDGELGLSFSKICNSGNICPATAIQGSASTNWGCTKDNRTGLIWEIKSTDRNNLRYGGATYFNPTTSIAGSANAFVSSVNTTSMCGFNDWRLPTPRELQSLANYTRGTTTGNTLDKTWFPENVGGLYDFTSLAVQGNDLNSWTFYYNSGQVSPLSRTGAGGNVRLVRSGSQPPTVNRYKQVAGVGQDEVYDTNTALVWKHCLEGMNWNSSSQTCTGTASMFTQEQALKAAVLTKYRLPNIKELFSIADQSRAAPSFDPAVFPHYGVCEMWSSTPDAEHPAIAWHMKSNGYINNGWDRSSLFCVRLVR